MKFHLGSRNPSGHFNQFMVHNCFELTAGLTSRGTDTDALLEQRLLRHLVPPLEHET